MPASEEEALVLAVDDQPENLELVTAILAGEGYRIQVAGDGKAALDSVSRERPDCIVLDVMMPRMDGFEVCRRLKEDRRTHFIPVVMLTALSAVNDKVQAYDAGADDFLNKPVHANELRARVRSLVRIKRLRDELDTSENIIVSMVQALESKDPRSAGHSERVARRAIRLARRLDLEPGSVETVGKAALLHDLGKIGVPERSLREPDRLSSEGREEYRRHPLLGARILSPLESFRKVRKIIRHHHERLDGSGYPDRVSWSDFDVMTEIVSLANYFDHLHSRGPENEVRERLDRSIGKGQFRREVVEELLEVEPRTPEAAEGWQERSGESWLELLPVEDVAHTGRILVVDDTASNREVLETVLGEAGHEVITVGTGEATLTALSEEVPDLLLLDVHLPDIDGFEVCRRVKERPETEFLPVILVTAHHELRDRNLSSEVRADDFLVYPIDRLELIARVESLLRLRLYFQDLEEYQGVILSLASALEAKDPYTRGHSERVGFLAARISRELGLPEDRSEEMLVAGLLHDIGKIGVPEDLLNKAGPLTEEEFLAVMAHPILGEEICRPLRSARSALPVIRHHHERYDGSGYPDHLTGDEIPLGARILGVADAYDALTSARSYRRSLECQEAVDLLRRETERGRWDPEIFDALVEVVAQSRGGGAA
ncbi:MAG: response regulator [Thermoanaerobaculia bacterium]|nr:response regulator [Thermoanaerobaculia bacterium]